MAAHDNVKQFSINNDALAMIARAREEGIETVWDRLAAQQPQCGYCAMGVSCRNCSMGPCRVDPFGDGPQKGVCGADADIIVARNLGRTIAAGASAHSDHGRDILEVFAELAKGESSGYELRDETKLRSLAGEWGIETDGRPLEEVARDLADSMMEEYGTAKGHLTFAGRVPEVRTELWKQSGHYENYKDDMFLLEVNDEEYGLKPMNCPGHATIFDQQSWSYRDLPERYFENGKVYRKEQRGELSGLSRVWSFTIDDGHLFVRPDQIRAEIESVIGMIFEVVETLDLEVEVALATRPEKSVGGDEIWESAESQLRDVLESGGYEYDVEPGDGAFYGPKIDFGFEDALGRVWDGPTVQLDFNMPERFGLTYTGEDNDEHRPVMIHRALYGSYERFFMVLIEHFDGDFPLWLAPMQVRILPVSDETLGYAHRVKNELADAGFRVEVEDRDWTVGRKIRAAHDDRLPYMLVVGDDEADAGTVSVRDRFENQRGDVPLETFLEHLVDERDEKRVEPDFVST